MKNAYDKNFSPIRRTRPEFWLSHSPSMAFSRNLKALVLVELESLAKFQIKADTVVKLLSDRNFKICFHLFSMSVLASEGRNRPKKVDPGVKFEFSQSRNQRWAKYSKYSYSSTILPVLVLVLGRSVLVLVLVLENKKINT